MSRGAFGSKRSLAIAAAVTSAVVAAIAFAVSNGSQASPPPGTPVGGETPAAGTVTLGDLPEFAMLAWSWGVSNSGSTQVGGGAGAGKANIQDISLTRVTDATTVELLKAVTTGSHFATAVVTATQADGATLVLELENVLVSAVSLGGSGGENAKTENLTLNFAKVTWTHSDSLGNEESGSWDIAENAP
jgi:type VI secretion system secreted protein Hcp